MSYKYNDCKPNDLTLMFTIAAWYTDVDIAAGENDEVLDWTNKRSLAIMDLIPNDADGIFF